MRAYLPPLGPTVLLTCFTVLDRMRPAVGQNTTPHDLHRRRALPAVIARVGCVMTPVMSLLAALGVATAAYSQQPYVNVRRRLRRSGRHGSRPCPTRPMLRRSRRRMRAPVGRRGSPQAR